MWTRFREFQSADIVADATAARFDVINRQQKQNRAAEIADRRLKLLRHNSHDRRIFGRESLRERLDGLGVYSQISPIRFVGDVDTSSYQSTGADETPWNRHPDT